MIKRNKPAVRVGERIPGGSRSYLQEWYRGLGITPSRLEGVQGSGEGWYRLAIFVLSEAVLAAAQSEDAVEAEEAREWLQSPAAGVLFEACNLNHKRVQEWLNNGCPLPDDVFLNSATNGLTQNGQECSGVVYGRLLDEKYAALPLEEVERELFTAGWGIEME